MRVLIPFLFVFFAASSFAAELVPLRHNEHLGARVQANELPDGFRRDLTSGLTNRLMIRVTLHRATQQLHTRSVQIAVRYDLWDEKFIVTTQLDGVGADTVDLTDVQQVIQRLQEIRLPELFSMSAVPADSDVTMRAVVLLNPIDRERMDAIREWVAQNSNRSSLDPAGVLGAGDMSVSNAIFNRIFEQYASGSDLASAWQRTLTTKPFRAHEMPKEAR